MPAKNSEILLSVTPVKAAAMTGRTRTRIFNAIRGGELTAKKDGKATLIEIDELRRWVKALPKRTTKAA